MPRGASSYLFGRFTLDALGRELRLGETRVELPVSAIECLIHLVKNRERPVSRDELMAAAWGRRDDADSLLAHTVVRLRKVLADDPALAQPIRTIPRLGYRWEIPTEARPASTATRTLSSGLAPLAASTRAGLLVLPAQVVASADWSWLRLGLMDLAGSRLRASGLTVLPSDSVLALLREAPAGEPERPAAGTRMQASADAQLRVGAELRNGTWTVQLQLQGTGGDPLVIQSSAPDPVAATRLAVDALLISTGSRPALPALGEPAADRESFLQQLRAAILARQLWIARELLTHAPEHLRDDPEVRLTAMQIDLADGNDATAERCLLQLEQADPVHLRAAIQLGLADLHRHRGEGAAAGRCYHAALAQPGVQQQPQRVADAVLGLGLLALDDSHLDRADCAFGRARLHYERSTDPYGVAVAELHQARVLVQRGQPALAAPMLEAVATQFQRLGAVAATQQALIALAQAQLALAQPQQALLSTERFWPLAMQTTSGSSQRALHCMRARALIGVGQLAAAVALLERIGTMQPTGRDSAAALAALLRIRCAVLADDLPLAQSHIDAAVELELHAVGEADLGGFWLDRREIAQRSDGLTAAATPLAEMRQWASTANTPLPALFLALAEAEHAAARGDATVCRRADADALHKASALGSPDLLIAVVERAALHALARADLEQASALAGRITVWAELDWRAAATQSRVHAALGDARLAARWAATSVRLAGERQLLPALPLAMPPS